MFERVKNCRKCNFLENHWLEFVTSAFFNFHLILLLLKLKRTHFLKRISKKWCSLISLSFKVNFYQPNGFSAWEQLVNHHNTRNGPEEEFNYGSFRDRMDSGESREKIKTSCKCFWSWNNGWRLKRRKLELLALVFSLGLLEEDITFLKLLVKYAR